MPAPINKPLMLLNMESAFERLFPDVPTNVSGVCLYWAAAAIQTLVDRNLSPRLMAGSMSWPIMPEHLDDGVCDTHFSYEYEPDHLLSGLSMAFGNLPEMHVWVFLEDTRETIDPSTKFIKEHFQQMMPHVKWRTPNPPNCLWSRKLPPRVQYRSHPEAVEVARQAHKNLNVPLPVDPRSRERD